MKAHQNPEDILHRERRDRKRDDLSQQLVQTDNGARSDDLSKTVSTK
jgi:hypothetical protein